MYTTTAYWSILPGKHNQAWQALRALERQVQEAEPDTWMYHIFEPKLDAGVHSYPPASYTEVVFFEVYKDQAAFLKHLTGPIFTAFVKEHGDLFLNMYGRDVPFVMAEALQRVDGFIRDIQLEPRMYATIARWSIVPGQETQVYSALKGYVERVEKEEKKETVLYTVHKPYPDPGSSFPTQPDNRLVFFSVFTDTEGFVKHRDAGPYQDFLNEYGKLFLQVGANTTTQPFMTASALTHVTGFTRKQARAGYSLTK